MSDLIIQLFRQASQISETTQNSCDIGKVEQYYILHNLWSRHSPMPSRPIFNTAWFEAGVLTETMIFLAFHGFYEQACATLRMQLDGFLTRLHWDLVDKDVEQKSPFIEDRLKIGYWEWESGKERGYPNLNQVFRTLRKEKYFKAFDGSYDLKAGIDVHNLLLHKYVHGRPPSRHEPGSSRSSVINIKFEKARFEEWFELLKTNFEFMIIVSLLLYPEYIKRPSWREFILLTPERMKQINSIGIVND